MTRNAVYSAVSQQGDGPKRNAFTLIELLVVIAIISLLVSILLPSLQKAKQLAAVAACSSNERSLFLGFSLYAEDYDGTLPHSRIQYPGESVPVDWFIRAKDAYLDGSSSLFFCPADPDINHSWGVSHINISIGANETGPFPWNAFQNINLYTIEEPGNKAMFCDSQYRSPTSWRYVATGYAGPDYWPSDRHFGGSNIAFCDGHVDTLSWDNMHVYWTGTVTAAESYELWGLPWKPIIP